MIRDLKPVWRRSSDTEISGTSATLIAVLMLALMAALAGGAALHESVTIDEVAHIGAGVSYLQKLDLRMNAEHPPLPKVLAALPLVFRGVHADYSHPSWEFSEKFFPAYLGQWVFGEWLLEKWNEPTVVLMLARLPMLLLTLALGWVVYTCARRLGRYIGRVALPQRVCQYTRISRLWTARPHRLGSNTVFPARSVDLWGGMA